MMSAAMTPQPPIQPTRGLNALVAHVKVAPQSGSALFICWKAREMNHIGKKAQMVTIGACTPIATTTKPSVAARLYAGAVEAMPMTTLEIRPSAPDLSPFSCARFAGSTINATLPPLTWAYPHASLFNSVQNLPDTIAYSSTVNDLGW